MNTDQPTPATPEQPVTSEAEKLAELTIAYFEDRGNLDFDEGEQEDRLRVIADLTEGNQAAIDFAVAAAVADAEKKIEDQRRRIVYLEGATNHACGTPLSIATAKLTAAETALAAARRETDEANYGKIQALKFATALAARLETTRQSLGTLVDAVNVEFQGGMKDIGGKTGPALIEAVNTLAKAIGDGSSLTVVSKERLEALEKIVELAKGFLAAHEAWTEDQQLAEAFVCYKAADAVRVALAALASGEKGKETT
jgi:hypothetical protein